MAAVVLTAFCGVGHTRRFRAAKRSSIFRVARSARNAGGRTGWSARKAVSSLEVAVGAAYDAGHAALEVGPCGAAATVGLRGIPAPQSVKAWVETLPGELLELLSKAEEVGEGQRIWIVGGALRDVLSGAEPHEVDLCSTLLPEEVLRVFPESRETGARFGTVTIEYRGVSVECTTLRADSDSYSDGRRPDSVTFCSSLREDLVRRDFTINAMALDAQRLLLYDPFGGLDDCLSGTLRAIGDAETRLRQDSLRVIRGYRFLGAVVPGQTGRRADDMLASALRKTAPLMHDISRQRVTAELKRILGGPTAPEVIATMADDGALQVALAGAGPRSRDSREVIALACLWQRGAFEWSRACAGASEHPLWLLALVILLADDPEAAAICKALKLTKKEQEIIARHLGCLGHLPDSECVEDVRCYTSALGVGFVSAQLQLERAWAASSDSSKEAEALVEGVSTMVSSLRPGSVAPKPLVDGRWIMENLGCKGALVARWKNRLYYEQVAYDVQDLAGMEAVLARLVASDSDPVNDETRVVAWPPSAKSRRRIGRK